ncbi:hypothetical protein [Paenibacillus antri]|nr:hypothetical protein [Paenibacillus antri]
MDTLQAADYAATVATAERLLEEAGLSEAEKAAVFGGNAVRVYKLA